MLQECKVRQSDPVVLLIHATSPKFDFTSQGKGTVTMSESMENELARLLRWVTRKWKQEMNRKGARDNDDALTAAQIEKCGRKTACRARRTRSSRRIRGHAGSLPEGLGRPRHVHREASHVQRTTARGLSLSCGMCHTSPMAFARGASWNFGLQIK